MNFKIEKEKICKVMSHLSKVLGVTMILPIYKGVHIKVENGIVSFTVSDGTVSMKEIVAQEAVIYEDGEAVVDGRLLYEIVKKEDSGLLWVRTDESMMKIKNKSSEMKLVIFSQNEYPDIDFQFPVDRMRVNAWTLLQAIEKTIFSASDQQTRPVLGGLNFHVHENECVTVGTDSYRLSRIKIPVICDSDIAMTIPKKMLSLVDTIYENDEEIALYFSERKALISNDDIIIQSVLLEGQFPDIEKLIPHKFEFEVKLNTALLTKALDRTSFNKQDGVTTIGLELLNDEIVLTSESKEIGSTLETLPVQDVEGHGELKFFCNQQYFLEAVNSIDESACILHFNSDMKPFILTGVEKSNQIQLLLPVRHN